MKTIREGNVEIAEDAIGIVRFTCGVWSWALTLQSAKDLHRALTRYLKEKEK